MAISSHLMMMSTPSISQSASKTSAMLSSSNSCLFNRSTFKTLNQVVVVGKNRSRATGGGLSCTCMFGLGMPELVVIAGVATLVFGPKKLPEVGKTIGKTFKSFQQAAKEFETELRKEEPESLENSKPAVIEIIEQENQDAKTTQVSL